MFVPSLLLKQLYTFGSLENGFEGVQFALKNRLSYASFTGLSGVKINGSSIALDLVTLDFGSETILKPDQVSPSQPVDFPLRQTVLLKAAIPPLTEGKHKIEITFQSKPFGKLSFSVDDAISVEDENRILIPRDPRDDFNPEIVKRRQKFVADSAGMTLEHLSKFSFDPAIVQGNIEHFTGVAQVPIGFAGPLKVNGEYADGEFLIPLATTEGSLVASYNRGIKMINLCGGITTTISDDIMQRAPGFIFDSARQARAFARWIDKNIEDIRKQAEATSNVAKLIDIQKFLTSKLVYLRFNYTTGDAAGQNMVTAATFAACNWILDHFKGIRRHYMDGNMTTDKKTSTLNTLHTRGKRVTAEIILQRDLLIEHLRVDPEACEYYMKVSSLGTFMAGGSSNGVQSANALAALFIATGQDVANVVESSTGMVHMETTSEGDLYASLTLPSLIVGTYGGGTGLATQRECLEILGCYGTGKALKFAEIVTAVAAAGEISLGAAVSSLEWVAAHEKLGRNR